jgi:tetratricopeptide (TPR) repeat protein
MGIDRLQTISDSYREQQKALHLNPSYGVASLSFAPIVAGIIRSLGIADVSDYGAGKMNLRKGLAEAGLADIGYKAYDPAFPEYGEPQAGGLVCCIDVLEHIEPDLLENVLDELAKITLTFGFFTIHMKPAIKELPDGRNAHLIQKPSSWWLSKLVRRFEIRHLETLPGAYGFWVLVQPREQPSDLDDDVSEEDFELARSFFMQGIELFAAGKFSQAEQKYRASLRILPNRTSPMINLASALLAQDKTAEGMNFAQRAVELEPENPEALLNLALAHEKTKNYEESLCWYEKLLALHPEHSVAWSNKGALLDDICRYEEALNCHERSIALNPLDASAFNNLGATLMHMRRIESAFNAYERAVQLDPENGVAKYNLGMYYLNHQQFAKGWPLNEYRWTPGIISAPPLQTSKPKWNGGHVQGTLRIWAEQGVGDQILFLSMLPDALKLADRVVVTVPNRLLRLLKRSFPDVPMMSAEAAMPDGLFDSQIPMGSLGGILRTDKKAFETQPECYLKADEIIVAKLKAKINPGGRKICGISWVSKNNKVGELKSATLNDLTSLLRMEGYVFVDLQYGDTSKERHDLEIATGIKIHKLEEIDSYNDLDGFAALVGACDLIISVSNTTVHFAGALGKPVFMMVPYSAGKLWYWHDGQAQSIWYPSVRIFRQQAMGDWAGPIEAIRQELMK